ncbi:MAG: peptidoglycan DD-metalloendopeptidase family protein [Actinomycetota bacterium]|nr:peptidoglycan DD-metalloendopeptidase family protein [Actinomycetota bacterium]
MTSKRAGGALVCALVLLAGLAWIVAASARANAATTGQLQQRIAAGQGQVSALAGAVGSASQRVARLGASVAALQRQVDRLQADLNAKRAELLKLANELAAARVRLAHLEAEQVRTEGVLSQQLVGSYEADRPDLVSVVLESTGFRNLLERLAFAQRIGRHDAQIVGQVKAARRAVAAEATRLGGLSVRQRQLTTQVLDERNSVDRSRLTLVSTQIAATRVRDAKAGQLASARQSVAALHTQLVSLRAAQAAAAARAARAAVAARPSSPSTGSSGSSSSGAGSSGSGSGSAPPSGPVQAPSSGGFTFPMPTGSASPPSTWSLDDGVDISAPGGTPELAVCSGTIVLHGIGGFGPSAPVLHCDSPLSGYSYVYYGHAGPGNWVPVGAHVGQGQVISEVGSGIVGISSGPHLEIGFADSSGAPVGPGSASAMMALLRGSF